MNDLSKPLPARLVTIFGTVLHIDAASGLLRHGDIEAGAANLVLVPDPGSPVPHRRGWLMVERDGVRRPVAVAADGRPGAPRAGEGEDSAEAAALEIIPLERGMIGLRHEGRFLCAQPDGSVDGSREQCSTWECFLASENWCTDAGAASAPEIARPAGAQIDTKSIRSHLISPMARVQAGRSPRAAKVLIRGWPFWSHGRVYYDLCKQLDRRGYIVDILNWRGDHRDQVRQLMQYYDLFITALDGVRTLVNLYGVPCDRVIGVSHSQWDIRTLIEQKGREFFETLGGYVVISDFLYCSSLTQGVAREPKVAGLGVDYDDFRIPVSDRLETVGYASSMSCTDYGVEWKRGHLAEAAARDAGLAFKVAGSMSNAMSFHDMPDFYRTVDAVLMSSVNEAGPLTVIEAAAAGRLVIGTPVGHFPEKACLGAGILAPAEAGKFKSFAAETLRYYKDNPAAYVEKCRAIQEAARLSDWSHVIGDWIEAIETARTPGAPR